ncbi:RNA pyrophosphohydrolase [Candidatus Brocadia pituitae]|nr:RNA pyrophosphohydrolase [Candidatus Brocadia pituitae]
MRKEHPQLSEGQVSGYFRANVGILIINPKDKRVLAAERKGVRGAWQLPQGGIDQDEEESDSALREIREELGFNQRDTQNLLKPIDTYPCWFAYQLPKSSGKHGIGQAQKFFAYHFLGEDRDLNERIKKSEEFCAWKWIKMSELIKEVWEVRRPVYESVARAFSQWLA